jgi:hypothetical protein
MDKFQDLDCGENSHVVPLVSTLEDFSDGEVCHPVGDGEFTNSSIGERFLINATNSVKAAAATAVDEMFGMLSLVAADQAESKEEDQEVFESSGLEQTEQHPDVVEQVGKAFTELPQKVGLLAEKQTIRLSSDDFVKLLKSLPGFEIPEGSSLSDLKALVIEGNELRLEGTAVIKFKAPDGQSMNLNLRDFKGKLEADPTDPSKLKIVDIQGFTVSPAASPFVFVQIKDVALSTRELDGKNVPLLQITKHSLGGLAVALPPEQKKLLDMAVSANFPLPIEDPEVVARVDKLVQSLSRWSSQPEQGKDASDLTGAVGGMFVEDSVMQLFKGARDVQKDGDQVTIVPSERMPLPAGLPVAFEKSVSGRVVREGQGLSFTDIEGASLKVDLPVAFRQQLGLSDKLQVRSIETGAPDSAGNRVATMKLGGSVEGTVRVTLGPDMRPLRVDGEGNIRANLEFSKEGKSIAAEVTFNPAGSEGKACCAYEQLLGRVPDPSSSWAVNAFENGETFKSVAKTITLNQEFKNSIPGKEAEIIPFLYRRLLGREMAPGEDNGVHIKMLKDKGVDAVISALLDSEEFARKHPEIKLQIKLNGRGGSATDVLQNLAGSKLDPAFADFLRGAESATLTQDGRIVVQHSAAGLPAGLPVHFDKTVSAKVTRDGDKVVLSDIRGAFLRGDLGEALVGKTGLQGAPVKSLEFSAPDAKGYRLATLKLGGPVEAQCQILVGSDMQPVVVDHSGSISLRVELKNGDNTVVADVRVNPSGVPDKVKRLYSQVLERQPDGVGSNWIDAAFARGDSYKSIVLAIINNPGGEFRNAIPRDKNQVIPFLYRRLHNRDYVPGEDNGNWKRILDEFGLDRVIEGILDSDEFKCSHPDAQISVNVGSSSSAGNVLEALTGRPMDQRVKDFVQGGVRVAIAHDGRVHVHRDQPTRLGNLPLISDGAASFKQIADSSVELAVESVGVKAQLPVPSEILNKLGCPADAPVKLTTVSRPDANGNRTVELKFDHPMLKSVRIVLDKNGAPLIENGRVRAKISLDVNGKNLDCQIDAASQGGSDQPLYIAVDGDPSSKVELLKRIGTPPELAEVAGAVAGIIVEGNTVSLHFGARQRVSMKGMNMEFDSVVTVTAINSDSQVFGMRDVRRLSVSGVQITGFNFGGDRWGLASARLHQFLYNQNDLPIKLDSLTFGEELTGRLRISFTANAGGLKSGTFVLESKDNPSFVRGRVTVKNPLRNFSPTGLIFGGNDKEMTVDLTENGLANPEKAAIDAVKPIVKDPIIRRVVLPPAVGLAVDLVDWLTD